MHPTDLEITDYVDGSLSTAAGTAGEDRAAVDQHLERCPDCRALVADFLDLRRTAAALQLEERTPFRILERGYAIVYDSSGKVLRSADQVDIGDDIAVRLARGELDATVRAKKKST